METLETLMAKRMMVIRQFEFAKAKLDPGSHFYERRIGCTTRRMNCRLKAIDKQIVALLESKDLRNPLNAVESPATGS
jgi:hypothetical protein